MSGADAPGSIGPGQLFVHVTVEGAIYVLPADGRDGWVTGAMLDRHVEEVNGVGGTVLLASSTRSALADPVLRRVLELGHRVELVEAPPYQPPPGREGYTALMQSAAIGAAHLVRDMLERAGPHGGLGLDAVDGFGYTALQYAAAEGHAEVVRMLLADGADPEVVNVHGNRALHLAAAMGHRQAVEALLAGGADGGAVGQLGHTARSAAEAGGFTGVVAAIDATVEGT